MKLEDELRQLFGATHDAPWPGEREGFERFLRRRARRGRAVAAAAGPGSEPPREATITVTAAGGNEPWDAASSKGSKRRADGRRYLLRPGSGPREVGRYLIEWPDFCPSRPGAGPSACRRMSSWPRVLVVTGVAAPGDAAGRQQVLRTMLRIVGALKPITDSRRPPPFPTVPPGTKVLLGKGGSGRTAWEVRVEPLHGAGGSGIHFPWVERREPGKGWHWGSLEPQRIARQGVSPLMDCLDWVPGSGLLLSGLAPSRWPPCGSSLRAGSR
jgi:hypothetical protein